MRLLITAALASLAAFSAAQNAYFTGALSASDPTWNRPLEGAGGLSGVGTNVFYDVQPFYVAANGTFTFETATLAGHDTFALIYQNAFSSATPLVNHVGSDDDFTGAYSILPGPYAIVGAATGAGGARPSSQVLNVALLANTQYFAINTSFGNGETGTYFSGIGGRSVTGAPIDVFLGTIPPVPEPATMAVLGLGALALLRKRRK